jgi:hypothetical protein
VPLSAAISSPDHPDISVVRHVPLARISQTNEAHRDAESAKVVVMQ